MSTPRATAPGLRSAALALVLLSLIPGTQDADASGSPATDPPVQILDTGAAPVATFDAGQTNYLIAARLDADTVMDLVNVTPFGAQILLNRGNNAFGVPQFERVQTLPVAFSAGGGALDMDGDGDLDLVLGDEDDVILATNDGTGLFDIDVLFTHGFSQATLAVPYRTLAGSTAPPSGSNRRQIVVAPAADFVVNDFLGTNPGGLPFGYIVVPPGEPVSQFDGGPLAEGHIVLQQLAPMYAHRTRIMDLDGDGDNDLVVGNKSAFATFPIAIYESIASLGLQATFQQKSLPDLAGVRFDFGYSPAVSDVGDLAFGSWQRAYVYGATGFTPPLGFGRLDLPLQNFSFAEDVLGDQTSLTLGEIFGLEFADLTGDGIDELVMTGANTSLVVTCFDSNSNAPPSRFDAPTVNQISRALALANWDNDGSGALDVIVGGTRGLFFFRNASSTGGGEATGPGTGPGEPEPPVDPGGGGGGTGGGGTGGGGTGGGGTGGGGTGGGGTGGGGTGGGGTGGGGTGGGGTGGGGTAPFDLASDAVEGLDALLDINRVPAVENLQARAFLADAFGELLHLSPAYLRTGALNASIPDDQEIQDIFLHIARAATLATDAQAALTFSERATFGPFVQAIVDDLTDASTQLAVTALGIGGTSAKPSRRERKIAKLREKAERDLDRSARWIQFARDTHDVKRRRRLLRKGILRNMKAYSKAVDAIVLRNEINR